MNVLVTLGKDSFSVSRKYFKHVGLCKGVRLFPYNSAACTDFTVQRKMWLIPY